MDHINASGLGRIDYLAAGTNDPELNFENQQNYRGTNSDLVLRGTDSFSIALINQAAVFLEVCRRCSTGNERQWPPAASRGSRISASPSRR